MGGAFELRRLAPDLRSLDPNAIPDLGFGPMTAQSIAGEVPEGAFTSAPSPEEKLRAMAEMGAGPVLAHGIAGNIHSAADATTDAMEHPSLASITNAGVRTGVAAMSPELTAASGLGGLSLAALKDLFSSAIPGADAKKLRRAAPSDAPIPAAVAPAADPDPLEAKYKDDPTISLLMGQIKQANADATRDYPGRNGDQSRAAARDAATKLQGTLAAELAKRDEASRAKTKGIYDQQVSEANAARDVELGKGRNFQDTSVGKVYDKMGGFAPMLGGMIPGAVSRLAKGPIKDGYDFAVRSGLGAIGGVMANNIPLAYNAFSTPVENPEQKAAAAYSFNLPDDHPDKKKYTDLANSLPKANPLRSAAADELYDPKKMLERAVQGGTEGFLGSEMGGDVLPAVGGLFRKSSWQMPEMATARNAGKLDQFNGKPPAIEDRIEPTLYGAFSAADGPFQAAAAPQAAISPPPVPSTPSVVMPPLPKTKGVQGPSAFDLMTRKPAAVAKDTDKTLAKADKQDALAKEKARIESLVPTLKAVHGFKRVTDAKKFLADHPDLQTEADVARHMTERQLEVMRQPDTTSKALDDLFSTDSGSPLMTRGQ
jgi:hypothetical protein